MNKEFRKLSQLKGWEQNPRSVTNEGIERLKKQIQKLGQYKPLLITEDGTVLGGNMRLKAYQDLGTEDIWVSVVDAPTEEKKIEYALSDNDRAGKYESDDLANLIGNFPTVDWAAFTVDIEEPLKISDLMDKFNTEFSLEDGDKAPFQQMTFFLSNEQAEVIKQAIKVASTINGETYGNENKNGNALFWAIQQWIQSNK